MVAPSTAPTMSVASRAARAGAAPAETSPAVSASSQRRKASAAASMAETGSWDSTLPLYASMYAGSGLCWLLLNPKRPLFDEEPR